MGWGGGVSHELMNRGLVLLRDGLPPSKQQDPVAHVLIESLALIVQACPPMS